MNPANTPTIATVTPRSHHDAHHNPDVLLRYCIAAMALRAHRMTPYIVLNLPDYRCLIPAAEIMLRQQAPASAEPMLQLGKYLDWCHYLVNKDIAKRRPCRNGSLLVRDETYRCARLAHAAGRLLQQNQTVTTTETTKPCPTLSSFPTASC